jgi:hypothetical protein
MRYPTPESVDDVHAGSSLDTLIVLDDVEGVGLNSVSAAVH